jgi:rhomboid family GlyGly-CTERM serine protease
MHHFALNALGLVLVWSLFADSYRAIEWTLIVMLSALAIGLGLWWFDPLLQWYVGASGVLHAVMAGGCVKRFTRGEWDRWIIAVGLTFKLVFEQSGQARGHSLSSGSLPIVIDAHLYGAVAGALIGAALCARIAIIRRR